MSSLIDGEPVLIFPQYQSPVLGKYSCGKKLFGHKTILAFLMDKIYDDSTPGLASMNVI